MKCLCQALTIFGIIPLLPSCASIDNMKRTGNPIELIGVPFELIGDTLQGIDAVTGGPKPQFSFDKEVRLERYLDQNNLAEAEKMLKAGANPNFKIGDKQAALHYAQKDKNEQAALLVRYGADKTEIDAMIEKRKVNEKRRKILLRELAAWRDDLGIGSKIKFFSYGLPLTKEILSIKSETIYVELRSSWFGSTKHSTTIKEVFPPSWNMANEIALACAGPSFYDTPFGSLYTFQVDTDTEDKTTSQDRLEDLESRVKESGSIFQKMSSHGDAQHRVLRGAQLD